jgi:ParB family transcriptional regulator, chromosome partitioning protein
MNTASPAPISVQHIQLDLIAADPNQVRKEFHVDQLSELAASIKAKGVVQPVVVVPDGSGFKLVAGERRLRASKIAGLADIPAVVRSDLKAEDIPVLQLVENLQREGLSLAEVSAGVTALCQKHSHDEVAELLGKSKSWVSKRVLVSEAPAAVKELVGKGSIEDAEIATGLGELMSIDKGASTRLARRIEKPESWEKPVTRDVVRAAIRDAKHRSKIRAEAAKSSAKTRAKQKDGSAAREAEAAKKRAAHAEALNKACQAFAVTASTALHEALGVKKGRDQWSGPIRLHAEHYSGYGYGSGGLPKDLADAEFTLRVDAGLALFKKLAGALGFQPKLRVQLPELSLEEAGKLAAALKGVKGVSFGSQFEGTAKQLAGTIQRLTPGQKPFPVPSVLKAEAAPTTAAAAKAAPNKKR